MKTLVLLLALFISFTCFAQPKGDTKNTNTYNNVQFEMTGNNRPNNNVTTFVSGPFQGPKTLNWVNVPISDTKNLFFYKNDSWIYFGHVEYTKKEVWYDNDVHYEDKPFMNGTGLYRYYPEGLRSIIMEDSNAEQGTAMGSSECPMGRSMRGNGKGIN